MGGLGKLLKMENNWNRRSSYQSKSFSVAEWSRVASCHRHLFFEIPAPMLQTHRVFVDVARNAGGKHVADVVMLGALTQLRIFTLEPVLSHDSLNVIGVPLLPV
jgi:hypothetical protein